MRKGLAVFLTVNLVVIIVLIHSVWTLLMLLITDGHRDSILRTEIPFLNSTDPLRGTPLIPNIIHQTYVNTSIPQHWQGAQKSCQRLHKDWEYKLWTDEASRTFISEAYPWFLDSFDSYPQPIQRADVIRYFVLAHFGGVYIDLDDGCKRSMEPLRIFPAWVRRTIPTGISNDVMASVPQHPFFLGVIEQLEQYNRNWGLPYITVMYSTGPLFLSVLWTEYLSRETPVEHRVRVMKPDMFDKCDWSFFTQHKGSSWHSGDAKLIFWMGRHWMLLTTTGFVVAGLVSLCAWWIYGRIFLLGGSSRSQGRHRFVPFSWRRTSYKRLTDRNGHEG